MLLLQQAPRFDLAGAARLARELYALDASASLLHSERDQNFLLATRAGDRYVLKAANATENRAMLEAQNAAMAHVAERVTFCPRVLPTIAGDTIGIAPDSGHLVRIVTYLDGIPDDEYLAVSQGPIRRTLPALAAIPPRMAEQALRWACGHVSGDPFWVADFPTEGFSLPRPRCSRYDLVLKPFEEADTWLNR